MTLSATEDQLRWGSAVSILSLDRTRPFYQLMGVPTTSEDLFLRLVRRAIVENRENFSRDPSVIPDISKLLSDILGSNLGLDAAIKLGTWIRHGFVYTPRDLLPADEWWQVFLLSRRDKDRWARLDLPQRVSAEALDTLNRARDRRALLALEDQVTSKRLSRWDMEMYALHGYDSEDSDPFHRINLTVLKRAMLGYLRWLHKALSPEEAARMLVGTEYVRREIGALVGTAPLQSLAEVIAQHADDST